jgi:hypothetical protein
MPGCPSRINDPNEQFRDLASNVCAGCGRWRYLPHSLIAGVAIMLIAVVVGIVWLVGMPARSYETKYEAFLRNDGRIDEKEEAELAKLVEKHRLTNEIIAQAQGNVRQRLGLGVKPELQPSVQPSLTVESRSTDRQVSARAF